MAKMNQILSSKIKGSPKRVENYLFSFALSILWSLITIPKFIKESREFSNLLANGISPTEPFYFTRIFALKPELLTAENAYVGIESLKSLSNDSFSIPEIIQRSFYFITDTSVYTNYMIFSIFYLTLWNFVCLLMFRKFIRSKWDELVISGFASLALLFSFGEERLINTEYSFGRIINPQFSGFLWLTFILFLSYVIKSDEKSFQLWFVPLVFFLILQISRYSYLFTYLGILTSFALYIIYLMLKAKPKLAMTCTVSLCLSLIPFVIDTLSKREIEGFAAAAQRMGLIETRLPGALQTVLVAFLIICLVLISRRFSVRTQKDLYEVDFSLLISSAGLVLASNSNVFSQKAIQFSDHFEVFVYLNVILFLISRFIIWQTYGDKKLNLIAIISVGTLLVAQMDLRNTFWFAAQSESASQFQAQAFESNSNFLVDAPNKEEIIPILFNASVLYDGRIVSYALNHDEVLYRYYLTRGCPEKFSKEDFNYVFTYSTAAYNEKALRVRSISERIGISEFTDPLASKLELTAKSTQLKFQKMVKNLQKEFPSSNCLEYVIAEGIDYILFGADSNWVGYFNKMDYPVEKNSIFDLNLVRIP
jgi:hypothetical protein